MMARTKVKDSQIDGASVQDLRVWGFGARAWSHEARVHQSQGTAYIQHEQQRLQQQRARRTKGNMHTQLRLGGGGGGWTWPWIFSENPRQIDGLGFGVKRLLHVVSYDV